MEAVTFPEFAAEVHVTDRVSAERIVRRRIDPRIGVLAALASVSLATGALVYLFARPAGHALLIPMHFQIGALVDAGMVTATLPTLSHAFALTLLIALVLGPHTRSGLVGTGAAWFTVEALFELGQHPVMVRLFESVMQAPLLDHVFRYFRHGVFDPLDIAAALTGVIAACLTYHFTMRHEEARHE